MINLLLQEIIKGAVPKPGAPNEPVVIEIPSDHPKAEKLLTLARALASQQRLPGGIHVKKLMKPGAADEFIEFLRELGVDPDEIRSAVSSRQATPVIDPMQLMELSRNADRARELISALEDGRAKPSEELGI